MPDVSTDTYLGKNILLMKPNWVQNPGIQTGFEQGSFVTFGVSQFYNYWDITKGILSFKYLCETKEQCSDFRDFFDDKLGRVKSFWIPSWRSDIEVLSSFVAADTVINIEDFKYDEVFLLEGVFGRHVHFWFPDGTSIIRKILDSDGTSITLSGQIGKDCDYVERLVVSFLYMVRFNQDEIEWNYNNQNTAEIDVEFKQVFDTVGSTTTTTTVSTTSTSSTTTSTTSTTTTTV